MEYNLRDVEWSWYWYRSKIIKLSDKCELKLCKWNSTLVIELNKWIELWINWMENRIDME